MRERRQAAKARAALPRGGGKGVGERSHGGKEAAQGLQAEAAQRQAEAAKQKSRAVPRDVKAVLERVIRDVIRREHPPEQ
eukprot:1563013-Pleurochrysis_carterae.AAC.1